jgi:hypothetical protein
LEDLPRKKNLENPIHAPTSAILTLPFDLKVKQAYGLP